MARGDATSSLQEVSSGKWVDFVESEAEGQCLEMLGSSVKNILCEAFFQGYCGLSREKVFFGKGGLDLTRVKGLAYCLGLEQQRMDAKKLRFCFFLGRLSSII